MLERGYIVEFRSNTKHGGQICIVANKKGKTENYRSTTAIEIPLSQYYCKISVTYSNTIAIVTISPGQ